MSKKENEAEGAEAEGAEGEEGAKKGKKKLLFIVVGVVLVLAIVGGLFAAGVIGGSKKAEEEKKEPTAEEVEKAKAAQKPVYYELPQFLANLNSNTSRASFLKMSVTLELKDQAAVATVDANKPRIVDTFNTYLRELHASDVQGSAGTSRLRDELLARLNATIEGEPVKDILFSEIIVQ